MKRRFSLYAAAPVFLLLFSCSYGLLNFSADKGDFYLESEINGDNPLGIDSISYSLTPPDGGQPVSFASAIENNRSHFELSGLTAGVWLYDIKISASGNVLGSVTGDFPVAKDQRNGGRMEIRYNGESYSLSVNWWDTQDGGETVDLIDSLRIHSNVIRYGGSPDLQARVRVLIGGSGFLGSLRRILLTAPDGCSLEYGTVYGRALSSGFGISDTLITGRMTPGSGTAGIAGRYFVSLSDNNGNTSFASADYPDGDYSLRVPLLQGIGSVGSYPTSVMSTTGTTFFWELQIPEGTANMLVYVIRKDGSVIYPPDDSISVAAASSGSFSTGPLSIGDYYFIAAAADSPAPAPYSAAASAGMSSGNFLPGNLPAALETLFSGLSFTGILIQEFDAY